MQEYNLLFSCKRTIPLKLQRLYYFFIKCIGYCCKNQFQLNNKKKKINLQKKCIRSEIYIQCTLNYPLCGLSVIFHEIIFMHTSIHVYKNYKI